MKIRNYFSNLYYTTTWGRAVIHPILQLRNFSIPLEKRLKIRFYRRLGYELNLNEPKSLNEKIQWLKLNDRSELHVQCADKYNVRNYVKERIGSEYLIPLIYHTKNPHDIDKKELPNYPFIIKNNHDSGGVTIVWNKNSFDWKKLKKKLKKELNHTYDYGKGEWQYQQIEPRIVIEKLLLDERGRVPSDFKLHVMNRKVKFIQVDMDRGADHRRNLYDANWNLLPCRRKFENGKLLERPENLSKMIFLAERLASEFAYVRVDLYNVDNRIFFGEMTFHPASGFEKFLPEEWDFKFGKLLELPKNFS